MNKLILCALCASLPAALGNLGNLGNLPGKALDSERDIAAYVPEQVALYVEAPGAAHLFESGLEHPTIARLLNSDLAQAALSEAPLSPEGALAFADGFMGFPVLARLAALTHDGVAFGLQEKHGKPAWSLVMRGGSNEQWRATIKTGMGRIATQLSLPASQLQDPQRNLHGVDVWMLGDKLTLGLKDNLFLASSDEGVLRDMIDLGVDERPAGVLVRADFNDARQDRRAGDLVWSWFDLDRLADYDSEAVHDVRELSTNPGVHFLLGGIAATLGSGGSASIALALATDSLQARVRTGGLADGPLRRTLPSESRSTPILPEVVAGETGRAVLYRDVATLFELRSELFTADVLPKFAEAISGLALFFGGADISDDILPAISPWLTLVVREATFEAGAVPEIRLPGAALLVEVLDEEQLGTRLVSAFQTAMGLINIGSAQKMEPPLTLTLALQAGVPVTSAYYPPPAPADGVDMRYNLVPACAMVGNVFVIGTHVSIVNELVQQLTSDQTRAQAGGEFLRLDGPSTLAVVSANREALVMNAVLNEGKTMEKARGDIAGLEGVLALIQELRIRTERISEDTHALQLELAWSAESDR